MSSHILGHRGAEDRFCQKSEDRFCPKSEDQFSQNAEARNLNQRREKITRDPPDFRPHSILHCILH